MDKGKMLWTVLGFGIALCIVGVAAYFLNTDGQPDDEEEEPVQPKTGVYLLHIEGIDGEAQDGDHTDWMVLDSFTMPSISVPTGGADRVSGEPVYEPIRIVKRVDAASPKLIQNCVEGKVIPKLVIEYCIVTSTDALVTIMAYEVTNLAIDSYVQSAGPLDGIPSEASQTAAPEQYQYYYDVGKGWSPDRPTETLTLNFEKMKITYTEFDSQWKSKGVVEVEFLVNGAV